MFRMHPKGESFDVLIHRLNWAQNNRSPFEYTQSKINVSPCVFIWVCYLFAHKLHAKRIWMVHKSPVSRNTTKSDSEIEWNPWVRIWHLKAKQIESRRPESPTKHTLLMNIIAVFHLPLPRSQCIRLIAAVRCCCYCVTSCLSFKFMHCISASAHSVYRSVYRTKYAQQQASSRRSARVADLFLGRDFEFTYDFSECPYSAIGMTIYSHAPASMRYSTQWSIPRAVRRSGHFYGLPYPYPSRACVGSGRARVPESETNGTVATRRML